jgi:hypothetical protein
MKSDMCTSYHSDVRQCVCQQGNGQSAPASVCSGAHTLLYLTPTSSAYLENVWGWVADHDIDSGKESAQINVYNAR